MVKPAKPFITALLFLFIQSVSALATPLPEELPGGGARTFPEGGPSLYEYFVGDGDVSQCNADAYGEIVTPYDKWSGPIRIDTDSRSGGCRFNLAFIDPHNQLSGWRATMTFSPTVDGGQCGGIGVHDLQVVSDRSKIDNSQAIRMDMDDRSGGCELTFSVGGKGPDMFIYFDADDAGTGQCGHIGLHRISAGQRETILLDTDRRPGGCILQFRLH